MCTKNLNIFFSCWRQGLFLERFSLTPFSILKKKITEAILVQHFCHFGAGDFILVNWLSEIPSSEMIPYCFSYYFGDSHHLPFILFSLLRLPIFTMDPTLASSWYVHPQGFTDLLCKVQDPMWVWSAPPGIHLLPPSYHLKFDWVYGLS